MTHLRPAVYDNAEDQALASALAEHLHCDVDSLDIAMLMTFYLGRPKSEQPYLREVLLGAAPDTNGNQEGQPRGGR